MLSRILARLHSVPPGSFPTSRALSPSLVGPDRPPSTRHDAVLPHATMYIALCRTSSVPLPTMCLCGRIRVRAQER